ncbi:ATP--cob(I)alamin adenosyltransferase [Nitrospira sp.]|nr:ATP--cob(I)alamin adenosyltransferase [Nitrospira sp.]
MTARRRSDPPPRPRRLRITKVYTRTGDKGRTRLAGGQSVWKDSPRVEAYGTVDELNAQLGLTVALLQADTPRTSAHRVLVTELGWIQNKLFDLGGILATAPGQIFPNMPRVIASDVARLERQMDTCQRDLKPLEEFILPGGGVASSALHVARTVCRRAERACVRLGRVEAIDPALVVFLNRLSDSLFVYARYLARHAGEPERVWTRNPT